MLKTIPLLLLVVLSFVQPNITSAHEGRPLYIEINEQDERIFTVLWKVPVTVDASNVPIVTLPEHCRAAAPISGRKMTRSQVYRCATDLSNASVSIRYPSYNPSISSLIHFKRLSGEKYTVVLDPETTDWQVPEKEDAWAVAKEYLKLGIKHILEGYDHLLFVACLMLLAGTLKRILITITGFTIAHSITLALASLGLLNVSIAPVEAVIALSIVLVATELARNRRDTLTWRYPIAVSSSVGLLHGFGFAAVLAEIGLPQTEIPMALLFFNLGIEVGQIMFVVAALLLFGIGKIIIKPLREMIFNDILIRIQRPAGYVLGTLAMFWTIERVSVFWA